MVLDSMRKGVRLMVKDKPRTIKCPICGKGKFVDVYHSSGQNSVACERCHQYIILDWDKMTAKPGNKIKQVANY